MIKIIATIAAAFCLSMISPSQAALADSEIESNFKDMFVTAGYSAAAGAAVGAALLAFQNEPMRHLKFLSVGASLGFLGGMSVGSWMVIAPIFAENNQVSPTQLAEHSGHNRLIVRPWVDLTKKSLSGLEAGVVFASF
jgi:membrane associated rhomboid family serine protease